jgi:YD repeat-containing protein
MNSLKVRRVFLCCAFLFLSALALRAQTVRYIYDELGRLVAVIDQNGDAAIYNYDPVGNLLSIARQSAGTVSILEFTPNGGSVGATVKLYGTGFSATAGQNTVTFNGTAATVTSSTTTEIVTSVPSGATTGTIVVTTPSGSATSASAFTVSASAAPTITSVSPTQGVVATSVTISGTNFKTTANQNVVTFNATPAPVSAATGTSIATAVPAAATSGKISVATVHGKATDTNDFIIPPSPYTTSDVLVVDRMTVGTSKSVTIGTANKIGLILFDAAAGQRVSLKVGTGMSATVTLYNHNGSPFDAVNAGGTEKFIDTVTLTATASYTILVDPIASATGTLTLTLYDVPADLTGTIPEDGTSYGVELLTPGRNARLTFSGEANQRVSLKVGTGPSGNVRILNPDRSILASVNIAGIFPTFIDAQTLALTGTYTVLVDYALKNTGSVTLNLYTVPADYTTSITAGGSSVTVPQPPTETIPGQNARATFTGTAGHRMAVWITNLSASPATVSLLDPSDATLSSSTFGVFGGFLEPTLLSASGTHTILIDPGGSSTGNATVNLYDVPADGTGTLTINGGGAGVTLAVGQNASYTFSGTASQQVTVRVSNSNIRTPTNTAGTVTVKLVRANGTVLTSTTSMGSTFNLATQTLPATETYTVLIDPTSANSGTLTVAVTNP